MNFVVVEILLLRLLTIPIVQMLEVWPMRNMIRLVAVHTLNIPETIYIGAVQPTDNKNDRIKVTGYYGFLLV